MAAVIDILKKLFADEEVKQQSKAPEPSAKKGDGMMNPAYRKHVIDAETNGEEPMDYQTWASTQKGR